MSQWVICPLVSHILCVWIRLLQELVDVYVEYPFFVRGQGWSSCSPQRTARLCGLQCRQLSVGDVCLALTPVSAPGSPLSASMEPKTSPKMPEDGRGPLKSQTPLSQGPSGAQKTGPEPIRRRHYSAPWAETFGDVSDVVNCAVINLYTLFLYLFNQAFCASLSFWCKHVSKRKATCRPLRVTGCKILGEPGEPKCKLMPLQGRLREPFQGLVFKYLHRSFKMLVFLLQSWLYPFIFLTKHIKILPQVCG